MDNISSTAKTNLKTKRHLAGSCITNQQSILFCFAVEDEARAFRSQTRHPILLTGIGDNNARTAIEKKLSEKRPTTVLTCGFAGGLNPELQAGTVLHSCDEYFQYSKALENAGSQEGTFVSSANILITPHEKASTYAKTRADAVEMESAVIHETCKIHGIPCATVRVISDTANEELPLNFNSFMNSEMKLSYVKMAWALCRKPWIAPRLIRFGSRIKCSARQLANTLALASKKFV